MSAHFREKIEKTKTFQDMSKFQRDMALTKTNVQHIEHGVTVSANSGYDYFVNTNRQYSDRNKNIIREIHESQQSKFA